MSKTERPTHDFRKQLSDCAGLASSLEMTKGYLQACANKHGSNAYLTRGQRICTRLAEKLLEMKSDTRPLLAYRSALYELDEVQFDAFAAIQIDYHARIADFAPVTANRYIADLTALVFALAAVQSPRCLGGVGTGLSARFRSGEAA